MSRLQPEKIFRDPIHNFIHVSESLIMDLINTREFQRLRRISELGVANTVFPGGEHSRFQHSLGTYEVARRLVDTFSKNYPSIWSDQDNLTVLSAALLHDVGHGAYSHTFEHIFNTDHEQYTQDIIRDENTQINQVLKQVSPSFPDEVASIIAKRHPNQLLVSMISSQIDADRMDYLLRDAYYTGATYGRFDIERIIRVARPTKNGIVFEQNGMNAVEDYVVSRYQMYLQVYFHPASRGMEVVLEHLLQRAKKIFAQTTDSDFLPTIVRPIFQDELSLAQYLRLDDSVFTTTFNLWRDHPDTILSDLTNRFLDRKPLKSIPANWQNLQKVEELKQQTQQSGFDIDYYTAENDAYDLPYVADDEMKPEITFITNRNELTPLSALSPIVAAIANRESIDKRFYMPREIWEANQ